MIERYQPGDGRPWNLDLAAHLLRRAGFGPSRAQLQQALADGPQRTIDRLLAPPSDFAAFDRRMDALGASVANSESASSQESSELWLYRMIETPYPLLEKMTLFWHDYLAAPGARMGRASLIEQRVRMLRRHALGRFDEIERDAARDPATPRRVVRKMYRWLVSEMQEPDEALVTPLAEAFARDFDIAKLAGTLLRSNHFFSPAAYRQKVKSPLEYALGIIAAFELRIAPARLHHELAALGQNLLEPPTREGWAGGRRWLNRYTLVARHNFAATLLAGLGAEALATVTAPEYQWA